MDTKGQLGNIELFNEFPRLADKMNWIPIGYYPTPVQETPELAECLNIGKLFIKRDDLSNPTYGGNKIRKLDFIIAEAQRKGARKVLTFGGIGSNHFLATTIHAHEHGLGSIGVLVPQPVTATVKRNMLCDLHYEAELNLAGSFSEAPLVALAAIARHTIEDKRPPFVIPAGGSSLLGVIGYINAAFELKEQINEGLLPEPDYIFVAAGTCGTASGLIAGCKAAGLKTKVIPVRVTDWKAANRMLLASLANRASIKLFASDQSFPLNIFTPFDVELITDYFGGEYGRLTCEGCEAIDVVKEHCEIGLEGVYTGKAFAGLIGMSKEKDLSGKTVLFWNTYNSVDLSPIAEQHEYHELPSEFHKYFEMPEHTLEDEEINVQA